MLKRKFKVGDRIKFIKFYVREPYLPGIILKIEKIQGNNLVLDNGTCWIDISYENDVFEYVDLEIFENLGD